MADTNPLSLERQVSFPFYAAANLLSRFQRPMLDALGLTYSQYLVMLALWERSPLAVGDVGRRLHLDSNTLTPVIKRMEVAGHVVRHRDPSDERRVLVTLTPQGQALREPARRLADDLAAQLPVSAKALENARDVVTNLLADLKRTERQT